MGERFNKLRFCILIFLIILLIPSLVEAKTVAELIDESRGQASYYAKKDAETIKAYNEARARDTYYKEAWYNKGNERGELGEYDKAIEAYDKAIAIDPYYKEAWYNKGNKLGELGEYDKAIEAFNKAIAIDPNFKYAWYGKGNALTKLGEYDKAIEAFDKAIAIDPNFKEAWNQKGVVHMYMDEDDKSIEAFDTIIALSPDDIHAKQNRNLAKMKPWLFLGGIALFTVIGIITVRNIRYNRNNNSKNITLDHNINKWKILGYVVITGFVFSLLVEIFAIIFSTYPINTDIVVWAWMPLLFGIMMSYRLKKNIELVYAFIIYIIVLLFGGIGVGILVSLGYIGRLYSKLEVQKFKKKQMVPKNE